MGTVILEEFGYDKVSHTYGTKQQIMDNLDKINPYEIVLSTDTNELYYKDSMDIVRNVTGYSKAMVEDTIETLKNNGNYRIGDVVEVLGYYTKGDGANHLRIISTIDDSSGVALTGGLFANVIHSGELNVKWFGAKGNGIDDDTQFIQKALEYCGGFYFYKNSYTQSEINEFVSISRNTKDIKTLIIDGNLVMKETLYVPSSVIIKGKNNNIYELSSTNKITFDLPSYNKCCVSSSCLKNNKDGTYTLIDPLYAPTGVEFDNGDYVSYSWGSKIGFSIDSKNVVKVGLKIFGPDLSTENMRIGNHVNCKIDIGWISSSNWCSKHYNPVVSARCNGYYIYDTNGGATYYSPICNMEKVEVNPTLDCIIKPNSISSEFLGSIAYYYDKASPIMYSPLSDGGVALHHCINNSSFPTIESPYCETSGGYGTFSIAILNRSNFVFSGGSSFYNLSENASSTSNKITRGNINACTFRVDSCFGRRIDLSKFTMENPNKLFKITNSNVLIEIGGVITGAFYTDSILHLGDGIENVKFLDVIDVIKVEDSGDDTKGLLPNNLNRALFLSEKFNTKTIQIKKNVLLTEDFNLHKEVNITSDGVKRIVDFGNKKINLYSDITFSSVDLSYTSEFLQSFNNVTANFVSANRVNSGESYIVAITTNSSARLNFDKNCDFTTQNFATHISRIGMIASDCILNISTPNFPKQQYGYFGNIKGGVVNRID